MEQNKQPSPAQQEAAARKKEKADKFWNIFLFTDGHGRLKSTTIIYSFFLSFLFAVIYGVMYLVLIDGLNSLLGDSCPVWLINAVESIVPAIIGSVLCNALFFAVKQKKLITAAYVWLFLYALVLLAGVLVGMQPQDWGIFLSLYAMVVPAPLILGLGLTCLLNKRYNQKLSANSFEENRGLERSGTERD